MRSNGIRRVCALTVLTPLLLVLSACDPAHPFDAVQVKVFSNGDGTAVIALRLGESSVTPTGRLDTHAFLTALISKWAIGTPAGDAAASPARSPFDDDTAIEVTAVDRHEIRLPLTALFDTMEEFAVGSNATVFLSLCTSALRGVATGEGVTIAHDSSCALWQSGEQAHVSIATAIVRFGSRRSPVRPFAVSVGIAVLVALGGAIAFRAIAGQSRQRWWLAAACIAMGVVLAFAVAATVAGFEARDTWFDTGQTFDQSIARDYRTVVIVGITGGIVAPALILLVGSRFRRDT